MEALALIKAQGLDSVEFAFLRAIHLFRRACSEDDRNLQRSEAVAESAKAAEASAAAIPDLQMEALVRYTRLTRPDQPDRADRLVRLLASLGQVASTTIRDLFFRATIGGHVDIDQIVIDMFKNSSV